MFTTTRRYSEFALLDTKLKALPGKAGEVRDWFKCLTDDKSISVEFHAIIIFLYRHMLGS